MHRTAIITDSTCNIPKEMVKQYDIRVVPQHLIWGVEDLLDLIDIDAAGFYRRLSTDPVHPKTSQPPAIEFVEFINAALKDGAKEILICTVSDQFSGTYASAMQAKDMVDIPVMVHNSRSVAMGLGWQVIAAARAREKGAALQALADAAEAVRKRQTTVAAVDTLEFLHKGGRIGGAARLIGTAFNFKPQIIIDSETGTVEQGKRTRTRTRSIEAMWEALFSKVDTSRPLHIAVHHAAAEIECNDLMARLKRDFPQAELVMSELTPVIGVHGGPGTLAMSGYSEE